MSAKGPEFEGATICRAYSLNGIPFIPHYRIPGLFVAPGGKTSTETELKARGAMRHDRKLWPREWTVEAGMQKEV